MKAIVNTDYGAPSDLSLRDVEEPVVGADGVVVRVRAAAVNPLDFHIARGTPYLVRLSEGRRGPKNAVRGVDVAGVVEAVGEEVTTLRPGDEVFGGRTGSFAELVRGIESDFVVKPPMLSFEDAAAIPIAGCTALQALRDKGRLTEGQRVVIVGAAGGVGTYAVQLAKFFGAHVTGVCSTRNIELVRSLGADEVVDYTSQDYTATPTPYDLIVDSICDKSTAARRRALHRDGTLVIVGSTNSGLWLGPVVDLFVPVVVSTFVHQRLVAFIAKLNQADLSLLADLASKGKIRSVIDRTYSLADVPSALSYLEEGHARGKVVITVP